MANILLLATAWGPKHGGINAFNMDFASALARYLKPSGRVFCAVLNASRDECERAQALGVTLVPIGKDIDTSSYDEAWAHTVRERLPRETSIDWWVGHDVTSAEAALKGPQVAEYGRTAVIMHMNYADYTSYKHGVGAEAAKKERLQRGSFKRAEKQFAVGPLLRNAMRDMVDGDQVTMLVPGFADIENRPATHELTVITFGRMDRESDRIKQGGLAVAGFATAVRMARQQEMPQPLCSNPQMRLIGIEKAGGDEEAELRRFASGKAEREINLIAQPFDEDREAVFDQLRRANIALMLSWHEGFGLTGWEAIAAEVPLIVGKQSGLYRLVDETLENPGTACLHPVDVQGKEGDDDTSNFTPADEEAVRKAIMDIAKDLQRAQRSAKHLKEELGKALDCTWETTARQFCEGLGLTPDEAPSPISINPAPDQHGTPPSGAVVQENRADARDTESPAPLIALPERPWPDSIALEMPDSLMLLPQQEIVPFHSYRQGLLEGVLTWAIAEGEPITVRLQAGEGGTGKTRLALEACRSLKSEHQWQVGFLQRIDHIKADFRKLLEDGRDWFVVVDYAETRAASVVELAETAFRGSAKGKVRLLLLARDGGDWWDRLADGVKDDAAVAALLRSPSTKTGPYRMSEEPIQPEARSAVFQEALVSFARAKRKEIPSVATPDLSADHFGQMLFIHLAALAALRGSQAFGDRELLDMAVGHERAYWRRLLDGAGLGEAWFDPLEQAIALLTLLGGAESARAAKVVIRRTPRLRGASLQVKDQLFDLLRRLYRRGGGLSGLQPDLLGEHLVAAALARDDELIDVALEDASPSAQAVNALTVLTRLARRDPTEGRWLARALERHLPRRIDEAFEVAVETGSPIPEMISAMLRASERSTQKRLVRTLRPQLPEETVNLRGLAIDIAEHDVALLRAQKGGAKGWKAAKRLKDAYQDLAARHDAAGRWKEAAEAEASALTYAELMGRHPGATNQAAVGWAHINLTIALVRTCAFEKALLHAEQGERIFRQLAKQEPNAYRDDWARSLSVLGGCLRDLGRYGDALAKAEQAEAMQRELAERQLGAPRPEWARSLGNLGGLLAILGRHGEALAHAEQVEVIFSELAQQDPDVYRDQWARSLRALGGCLRYLGRYEEALAKAEQAEAIHRELAGRQPDAYRDEWATSLSNLGTRLGELGRYEEALARAAQAEAIRRELAERQPEAYRDDWAASLQNLGVRLGELGRYEEGLAKIERAEAIHRELAERQPDAYRDDWAASLYSLSVHLSALGRHKQALARAEQAEAIHCEMADRQPDAYRDQWATSLTNLGARLGELGRYQEALAKAEQAEAIRRDLAEQQPEAYRADWSNSLTNIANHLRDLHRYDEALARAEQAEAIYAQLAERQPDAYRHSWALSLGNLAEMAVRGGQADRALPAAERGVQSLETLAVYPNDDRDHLGFCLRVLAEALLETGDATGALEQAERGEKVWATIFAERPAYACEQYGKSLPVLARARLAVQGEAAAVDTLLGGIESISPFFEQRPRALYSVMDGLVRTLRDIDPVACAERVPTELLEQLEALSCDVPRSQTLGSGSGLQN